MQPSLFWKFANLSSNIYEEPAEPLFFKLFKNQRGICAAETKGIGHCSIYLCLSCFIRNIIKVALRVRELIINCRMYYSINNCQYTDNSLNAAPCPKHMTCH